MKIETIDIDRVIPYARNPRKNSAAIDKVAASLREFGFRQPIVTDENLTVIVGHTRLAAAKKLNLSQVPVHIAEGLTDAQIKAYRIADNRVGEEAEWDNALLAVEIGDLKDQGYDLSLTGLSDLQLADLLPDVKALDEMPSLSSEDREPYQQMTFVLHDEQVEQVKAAIEAAHKLGEYNSLNDNRNGNAIARICETFVSGHAVG
jgi:ParB-like chromosome segregation protein Spo0J